VKNKIKTISLILFIATLLLFGALRGSRAASLATPAPAKLEPAKLEPVKTTPEIAPRIAPKTIPRLTPALVKKQPLSIKRKRPVLISVPPLTGLDISQALMILKRKKIDLKIKLSKKIYHPAIAAGHIIAQDPVPGASVTAKTSIKIIISKGRVPMPELKGKPVETAIKIFSERTGPYKPYALTIHQTGVFSGLRPGFIVRQVPETGTPLKKGARIMLYVSKGPVLRIAHPLPKTANRPRIAFSPEISALKSRVFTLKTTRVVQGTPAEIHFRGRQSNWKRAAFYIGSHKISPLASTRNGILRIPTQNIPPGRYKILARLPHVQKNVGEICILPKQLLERTPRLALTTRSGLPVTVEKPVLSREIKAPLLKPAPAGKGKPASSHKQFQKNHVKTKVRKTPNPPEQTVQRKPRIKPTGKTFIFSIPQEKLGAFKHMLAKNGVKVKIARKRFLKSLGVLLLSVQTTRPEKTKRIAARLTQQKIISAFQPMHTYHTRGLPSREDPFAVRQFGCLPLKKLSEIHAACSGQGIHIALLDTGVDIYHEDLDSGKIETIDFTREGLGKFLTDIHGTALCGILAARPKNGKGIIGLAPASKIHAIKVCKRISPSSIQATTNTFTLAEGLDYAIQKRVHIINVSIGGPRDRIIEKLINRARADKIIIVAAAGNGGPRSPPSYPAAYAGVIGVTAIDQNLHLYTKATQGRFVDIAAPGVDVFSLKPGNRYNFYTGTSFATVYVAGIIAMELSHFRSNPRAMPGEISTFLKHAVFQPSQVPPGKFGMGILLLSKIPEKLFF